MAVETSSESQTSGLDVDDPDTDSARSRVKSYPHTREKMWQNLLRILNLLKVKISGVKKSPTMNAPFQPLFSVYEKLFSTSEVDPEEVPKTQRVKRVKRAELFPETPGQVAPLHHCNFLVFALAFPPYIFQKM